MTRLLLRALAGMLAALVLAAASAYWLLVSPPGHPTDAEVEAEMRRVAPALVRRLAAMPLQQWDTAVEEFSERSELHASLMTAEDLGLPEYEYAQLRGGEPLFLTADEGGPTLWVLIPGGKAMLDLTMYGPLDDPNPSDLVTAAVAALVVFGIGGLLLVIPVVHRLRSIESAVRKFGNGDWGARADDGHPDAIGDVGRAMNGMAQKIEQLLQHQRELLQAVAHELRGPLSRLVFALEAERGTRPADGDDKISHDVDEAVEDLQELISEVLRFSRLQPGGAPLRVGDVAIQEVVNLVVNHARELNPKINIRVVLSDTISRRAQVDRDYLRRALANIIENASRYAHSTIEVSCSSDGVDFLVAVDDDGVGIPPYQRSRAFEPFTRIDASRSRHSGGTGLGLAIVRRITEQHHGAVSIQDSPLGGARLVLRWPLEHRCAVDAPSNRVARGTVSLKASSAHG